MNCENEGFWPSFLLGLQSSAMWGKRRKIQQSLLVHNLEISGISTLSEIYTNKKTHNIRKSRYLLHFEGVNG